MTVHAPPNLSGYVRRAAEAGPERPALIWNDQAVTWGDLDARVDAAARGLAAIAPAPTAGHPARVAIALPNTPDFAVAFFGALRAGLVAVPVNPEFTARELRHVLADSAAAILLCNEQVRDTVDGIRQELPALSTVQTSVSDWRDAAPAREAGGDDLAVLLYTSGTEGRPKGAMLSHRALIANHDQVAHVAPAVVGPDDVLLLAVPLFHAYGLNSGLGAVAYHGACGVLMERFDPAAALETIARTHVTAVIGVPSMYVGWSLLPDLGESMASVRFAACGAAPLEASTAARFTEATRHPVFVGYGLTETAPVLTSTLVSPVPKVGSIGQPIPGVELRLVGADGETLWHDGAVDPDAETEDELELELESPGTDPGEIVVRGANLFSGYWPDGRDGPDADGWWATGDVAYADADGDLFLVDRLGELILVSGFNVYPHEVEQVLAEMSEVVEAAAVGVPDERTGERVKAVIVLRDGAGLTEEQVREHCAARLAKFKVPGPIEFVTTLPHSITGKLRRASLRRADSV